MGELLPRDSKGRIQLRIWFVLIWLCMMVLVIGGASLLMALGFGAPFDGVNDARRGQQLGIGAALISAWVSAIVSGIIWWVRRSAD